MRIEKKEEKVGKVRRKATEGRDDDDEKKEKKMR